MKKIKNSIGYCIGLTSECGDGKHILMLDIDSSDLDLIRDYVNYLMHSRGFSIMRVIESSPKNYHLVSPEKIIFSELCDIAGTFGDPKWAEIRKKAGYFVLRLSSKNKTLPRIMCDYMYVDTFNVSMMPIRLISIPHAKFFKMTLPAGLPRIIINDESVKIRFDAYPTRGGDINAKFVCRGIEKIPDRVRDQQPGNDAEEYAKVGKGT